MKRYFGFTIAILAIQNSLFAAEAGMPQLDPKYWASQAFWLIIVFSALYISSLDFLNSFFFYFEAIAKAADAPQIATSPLVNSPKRQPRLKKLANRGPEMRVKNMVNMTTTSGTIPMLTTWSIVTPKPKRATPN